MPISLEWGNPEHSIILSAFVGPWTWTEYFSKAQQIAVMAKSVSHKVHIINMVEQAGLPTGPAVLQRFAQFWDLMPDNIGLIIGVVGSNASCRTVIELARWVSSRSAVSIRVVTSVEQAYEVLVLEAGFDRDVLQVRV